MKYTHATLLLNETGAEINETNLTAVLESAGAEFSVSRVKALVAALENVDVDAYAADPPEDAPEHDGGVATENASDAEGIGEGNGDDDGDAGPAAADGEAFAIDLEPSARDGSGSDR